MHMEYKTRRKVKDYLWYLVLGLSNWKKMELLLSEMEKLSSLRRQKIRSSVSEKINLRRGLDI